MGRPKKITEEKWRAAGEHYLDGHTLKETSVAFGISVPWLGKGLRERRVPIRKKFEPSNAAKAARLPPNKKAEFGLDIEEPQVTAPEAPRRHIIGGEHTDTYEEKF